MKLKLVSNGSDNVITPLGIPSYHDLGSDTRSADALVFEVAIQQGPVEKLSVKIAGKSGGLVQRNLGCEHARGRAAPLHLGRRRRARHARHEGAQVSPHGDVHRRPQRTAQGTVGEIHGATEGQSWVDAVVDTGGKTVAVELRVDLEGGGAERVSELPPKDVQRDAVFKRLPAHQRAAHARTRIFITLRADVLASPARHWSRSVTTPGGT
jgi:hypothetical protein